jgi:hypothetical protein
MTSKVYRRSPAVEETTVGERSVLYHNVSGAAIVLNPTASIIWADLARESDSEQLARSLHSRFATVSLDTVMKDVERVLQELEQQQLIVAG